VIIWLFVVGLVADIATTLFGLSVGCVELNPLWGVLGWWTLPVVAVLNVVYVWVGHWSCATLPFVEGFMATRWVPALLNTLNFFGICVACVVPYLALAYLVPLVGSIPFWRNRKRCGFAVGGVVQTSAYVLAVGVMYL